MAEYPHMRSQGDFPDVNGVNVYKYDNQLDYGRYDYAQMQICVCRVPWDMGEAHIGNRTIDGIGNVVYFEDKATRDAWFNAIPDTECFRWETKFKELHRDMVLNVPLPFDIAARYNYVYVRYNLFANDDSPLEYENSIGVREWFYFVREVRFIAPNTTQLVLMDDAWQTWIYDVTITGMILERGHAPMFATSVSSYLQNPIANCGDLLAEDVNFGELQCVTHSNPVTLNSTNMYACLALSQNPWGDWGEKQGNWNGDTWEDSTWTVPTGGKHHTESGVPAYRVVACKAADLNTFFDNVTDTAPQFKQIIQAVFFVSGDYLNFGNYGSEYLDEDGHFTLFNIDFWGVTSSKNVTENLLTLEQSQFNYPDRYANIAKLYTWPYAALVLTDEHGDNEIVHVEDTTGALTLSFAVNIVFPFLNITGNVNGIGGTVSNNVKFANLNERSFDFGGTWYEHVREWKIPTFAVMLDSHRVSDYSEHYDRVQDRVRYTNAYETARNNADLTRWNDYASATTQRGNANKSATATRDTAKKSATANRDNAKASADAAQTNAGRQATLVTNNASAQITANNTITHESNAASTADAGAVNGLNQALQAWDAGLSRDLVNTQSDAAQQSAAISATNAAVSGVAGGIASALAGNIGGAVSSLVSGGVQAATTGLSTAISINSATTQTELQVTAAQNKYNSTETNNTDRTTRTNTMRSRIRTATNTMTRTSANNTSSTITDNAKTSYSTATSNADTTYNAATDNADTMYSAATGNATDTYNTAQANRRRTYDYTFNGHGDWSGGLDNDIPADRSSNAVLARDTARNAITNRWKSQRMQAPSVFGTVDNASTATTRPMALFANVVTESESAIQQAGDYYLRYGYALNQYMAFDGNWNIGEHFTYWKLTDFWVTGLQVPDMYMDRLRFFLYGGVTIWKKPEDIGTISIYENGI